MTTCAFGSEPKSTTPTYFRFEGADIAGAIPGLGGLVFEWALGLPSGWQSSADFCSLAPTGDLPTELDWAALAFPPFALITGAYGRFGNQIRAWKFAELCQCAPDPVPTVACAAIWPTNQTFLGGGPAGSSIEHASSFTPGTGVTCYGVHLWSPQDLNYTVGVTLWDQTLGTNVYGQNYTGINTGYHNLVFTTPQALVSGHLYAVSYCLNLGYQNWSLNVAPPSNAMVTWGQLQYHTACGVRPQTNVAGWFAPILPDICTSDPGDPTPIDPPPDADPPPDWPDPVYGPEECNDSYICSTLYMLDRKVDQIARLLLDHSSRTVPYGYRTGTSHSGLTGDGGITVSGALGCVVSLTTVPASWGHSADTPRRLIPAAGSLQWGTVEGEFDQRFLHYDDEIFLSHLPGATQIVYNFRPGVTATITELLTP